MNIVREQKQQILESNTAQADLDAILEQLPDHSDSLVIHDALHGDLDFTELSDQITSIYIPEGEVTSIVNLPSTVTKLVCPHNFLFDLDGLHLEELDVQYNYISNIHLNNIKTLNVDHNQLVRIVLPATVESVMCSYNKIGTLDLTHCLHLTSLHCSHNHLLALKNIPKSLTDLEMDTVAHPKDKGETHHYIESINDFFRIKQTYEQKWSKSKQNAYKNAPNTRIGKQRLAAVVPLCIKCNKKGGTIFSTKENKYTAICGAHPPCTLDIQIYNGVHVGMEQLIYDFKEQIEVSKEKIIRQKFDTLFNYIDEGKTTVKFKKELEEYNSNNSIYKELLDKYNENRWSPYTMEAIEHKQEEVYECLGQIRELTEADEFHDAVHLHITKLIPLITGIRMLKNRINEMNGDVLFQHVLNIDQIDYIAGEKPRVVKFLK